MLRFDTTEEFRKLLQKNPNLHCKDFTKVLPTSTPPIQQPVFKRSESEEQQLLFAWASENIDIYPKLKLLFAIPNGGKRHIATAFRLKREGVRSGVPDICLPVAAKGYHGLYIEMKVKGNKPTDSQLQWHEWLRGEGYKVVVCYGCMEARDVIMEYLEV